MEKADVAALLARDPELYARAQQAVDAILEANWDAVDSAFSGTDVDNMEQAFYRLFVRMYLGGYAAARRQSTLSGGLDENEWDGAFGRGTDGEPGCSSDVTFDAHERGEEDGR